MNYMNESVYYAFRILLWLNGYLNVDQNYNC